MRGSHRRRHRLLLALAAAAGLIAPSSSAAPAQSAAPGTGPGTPPGQTAPTPTGAAPPAVPEGPQPPGLNAPDPRYTGTNPKRNPKGLTPFAIVEHKPLAPELRGIQLKPDRIELVQGGVLVGRIPFAAGGPVAFEDVARAVGDPDWIAEIAPGVFGLRAAFVQGPGTNVRYAGPGTIEMRLATQPAGVFIGGSGPTTTATFEGVKVTSWDLARRAPSEDIVAARPFVLFQNGARLDIARSEMAYLGADYVAAYGVSWRRGGATGTVTESVFHHNFFGVYTFEAKGIVYRHNVFRDNIFYGLDPHDNTTGLVVEDNEAYGNGSHGFIFSQGVSDGAMRRNHSHDNAGNGIVLDRGSDRNVVEANRVERNGLDGIVLLGSSGNEVRDNDVLGNRIGVRANQPGQGNVIRDNRLTANEVGLQAYAGASNLDISGNTMTGNATAGAILDAPESRLRGGRIQGGRRGLDVRAATNVSGVAISGVAEGVRVRPDGTASLRAMNVRASRTGVVTEPGAVAVLRGSTIDARTPTRGDVQLDDSNTIVDRMGNRSSMWLTVAGITALEIAVILEFLAHRRERRYSRQVTAAAGAGMKGAPKERGRWREARSDAG